MTIYEYNIYIATMKQDPVLARAVVEQAASDVRTERTAVDATDAAADAQGFPWLPCAVDGGSSQRSPAGSS